MEEVLGRQTAGVRRFCCTAIFDRMCGPLCDAVLGSAPSGQATLEYLERANLFSVPLDSERHWYRYHQLFRDLLRQRLGQSLAPDEIAGYHMRASQWYEEHGLRFEAFRHATAAHDIERAERLWEPGSPAVAGVKTVVEWLVRCRSPCWMTGPAVGAIATSTPDYRRGRELQAAEKPSAGPPMPARDSSDNRRPGTLAVTRYQSESHLEARRLSICPTGTAFRTATGLGIACQFRGPHRSAGPAKPGSRGLGARFQVWRSPTGAAGSGEPAPAGGRKPTGALAMPVTRESNGTWLGLGPSLRVERSGCRASRTTGMQQAQCSIARWTLHPQRSAGRVKLARGEVACKAPCWRNRADRAPRELCAARA